MNIVEFDGEIKEISHVGHELKRLLICCDGSSDRATVTVHVPETWKFFVGENVRMVGDYFVGDKVHIAGHLSDWYEGDNAIRNRRLIVVADYMYVNKEAENVCKG